MPLRRAFKTVVDYWPIVIALVYIIGTWSALNITLKAQEEKIENQDQKIEKIEDNQDELLMKMTEVKQDTAVIKKSIEYIEKHI